MATDEEQQSSAAPPQAPAPVHHKTLSEMDRLPDLPEDEGQDHLAEHEVFKPGPSFGEGL